MPGGDAQATSQDGIGFFECRALGWGQWPAAIGVRTYRAYVRWPEYATWNVVVPDVKSFDVDCARTYVLMCVPHSVVRAYAQVGLRTYVRTNARPSVRTYMRTYVHTYVGTLAFTRTYVHTYVRTYTHTYICTYVRTLIRTCRRYVRTYVAFTRTYVRTFRTSFQYVRTYVRGILGLQRS